MATIIKALPLTIKCSNPPKDDVESIRCMSIESITKVVPMSMIWVYSINSKTDKDHFMTSDKLQSTLSDTLNHFPILAGRLTQDAKGNVLVLLTNEGVSFTEAKCENQTLDYFIQRTEDCGDFSYASFDSSDLAAPINGDLTGPQLSVQVTRLKCGSVMLSITANHCLMDAYSVACFINTWASGGKTPPYPPMMDKNFVLLSSEQQSSLTITRPFGCASNRNGKTTIAPFPLPHQEPLISNVHYFSLSELKNIKEEAMKDLSMGDDYISTYDALFAHLILVVISATQPWFSQKNKLHIAQVLNGRSYFVPSYSPTVLNYFGSFSFWIYDQIQTQELPTLSSLAQRIHQLYKNQSEYSLKYYNAYLSSDDGNLDKNRIDADLIDSGLHCTSWRKMNMLEANFDGGDNYAVHYGPTTSGGLRNFLLMDANRKDESINVLLGLEESHYKTMLKQKLLHKYR
ncbi:hypothetical protein I4U23_000064 [Adineta vaga]|nr:hypothetical protein I4U23_000064 [Adineta vaga]